MDSKKIFLKYFLFFFLIFLLIFNWSKTSWIFSPNYVLRTLSFYFFEKEKTEKQTQKIEKEPQPESQSQSQSQSESESFEEEIFEREDSIEIKKIGIVAPIVRVEKEEDVKKALDKGVVLWPNSSLPGQKGQTIILGHSAPPQWPKIKYDWVFSQLNLLEKGDEIIIYFQKRKFRYQVERKVFLNKGEELPPPNSEHSVLFLISCWPPGKDIRRIVVEAFLVKE